MSEQILSQEEINALLNAMSKGEVDLESDRGETPNVRPYDFKTRGKMLQHQFHALDEVNDNLASLLQRSISSFLKRSVAVEFGSMEMMKFSEFMKIFPTPAIFGIFSMEPLVGSALVAVESGLALALVDCMFGGDGKLMPRDRDFTSIEKRLMGKFSRDLLSHLEAA